MHDHARKVTRNHHGVAWGVAPPPLQSFAEAADGCRAEGHLTRVDGVGGAVLSGVGRVEREG
eukprot:1255145-Prymnesium_polylepis.1